MISASNLEKAFGDRTLFRNVSLQLNPGERYGLVGANGSGKTTLLNILSGFDDPTGGTVSVPKDARLGVLRQDQFAYEDQEILGVALMGNPELWDAMVEKEKLLARAEADPEDFDANRFSHLEETVQRHDGYSAESRASTILEGLGLPSEIHRNPLSSLSGGFKLRVLLAQTLAANPDVLLLDEPTNHLDILSIRWLEKFLAEYSGPAVVISHDHRFLDHVVTTILDVDYETVTQYRGNYTSFLQQKEDDRLRREKEIETRAKEIAHHQQFVDRFRAKASKARQAQSKLKLIEKRSGELEALPGSSRRYPAFRFEPRRSSGKQVLTVKGVRKAFEDNEVLHGVDLTINRGDRIAIMGPNGIGKSTLLKILMGVLDADAGEVEWGYEAHTGYFAQDHHEQLTDLDRTAEAWLWDFCAGKDRGFVRGQLGLMLFSGDDGEKRLSALSGGEAARLVFARLALEQPNVLVLDEPTNHLDLESIEALVAGLERFEGTLVLVSHDRWFVSRLANRIIEITPTEIRDYPGTYEEYVHALGDDHLDADEVVLKASRARRDESRQSDSDGEGSGGVSRSRKGKPRHTSPAAEAARRQRELERRRKNLTAELEKAESRIAEIDDLFCQPDFFESTPPDEVGPLQDERAARQADVDRLMGEWEELETELESLGPLLDS